MTRICMCGRNRKMLKAACFHTRYLLTSDVIPVSHICVLGSHCGIAEHQTRWLMLTILYLALQGALAGGTGKEPPMPGECVIHS